MASSVSHYNPKMVSVRHLNFWRHEKLQQFYPKMVPKILDTLAVCYFWICDGPSLYILSPDSKLTTPMLLRWQDAVYQVYVQHTHVQTPPKRKLMSDVQALENMRSFDNMAH